MKKAKLIKNNKKEQVVENDTYSLKKLLLIIIVLSVLFGVFYLITYLLVDPKEENETDNEIVEIDESLIHLGNLLNRKEKEYYVLATKKSENNQTNYQELYNQYITKYSENDESLKFYNVDLDNAINKTYIGEELNITNNISEIKLNDDVLFKIKDNKIEKYFVGSKEIIKELSNLKES